MKINIFTENNKTYAKLEDLKLWDKNPRSIKESDFFRLGRQILGLEQFRPLIILSDGIVLGGNMRHRKYTDLLKDYDKLGLGGLTAKYNEGNDNNKLKEELTEEQVEKVINQIQKGIWIHVVNPKDENEKLKYALADNDRSGFYDDDLLANLIPEYKDFDWSDYAIDLSAPTPLDENLYTDEGLSDEFNLPSGDKDGFQEITFNLTDNQMAFVKNALEKAKESKEYENIADQTKNNNSNANALYLIIKQWVK